MKKMKIMLNPNEIAVLALHFDAVLDHTAGRHTHW